MPIFEFVVGSCSLVVDVPHGNGVLPVEPGVFEVLQECGNCGKFTVVHQGNGCVSLSYPSSWNEGKWHQT